MKKNKSWAHFFILVVGLILIGRFLFSPSDLNQFEPKKLMAPRVLVHDLRGVILDSRRWIDRVEPHIKKKSIKAVVFIVNSPGGVVGPSQELYEFIRLIRSKYEKPVIVYSSHVLASGAYYMAVGANKIVTNPGTLVGSIGVILEFLNLEGLYQWAKVQRYSIASGRFKDSGADYRPMRDDEKELFKQLIMNVYAQFTKTVQTERGLSDSEIQNVADGRVFTGEQALAAKLIDQVGDLQTAISLAAAEANEKQLEPYYIPKDTSFLEMLLQSSEEQNRDSASLQTALRLMEQKLRASLSGQLLYLLPGVMESHWVE